MLSGHFCNSELLAAAAPTAVSSDCDGGSELRAVAVGGVARAAAVPTVASVGDNGTMPPPHADPHQVGDVAPHQVGDGSALELVLFAFVVRGIGVLHIPVVVSS